MKVIFLDIDGVLNNNDTEESINGWVFVDDNLIENLAYVIEKTDAVVVLSSSWRSGYYGMQKGAPDDDEQWGIYEYKALVERLKKHSVHIYGHTRWPESSNRGEEIKAWLDEHNVKDFVILDDYDARISEYFPDNFVKTDWRYGLTMTSALKALMILDDPQYPCPF